MNCVLLNKPVIFRRTEEKREASVPS